MVLKRSDLTVKFPVAYKTLRCRKKRYTKSYSVTQTRATAVVACGQIALAARNPNHDRQSLGS
jgi:hypothetical protein